MNKTTLKDVIDINIVHVTGRKDIGGSGFQIIANIKGDVNKINNTADIHISCRINTRGSIASGTYEYKLFSLPAIASVLGASNISFDYYNTEVIPIYLSEEINSIGGYGFYGLVFEITNDNDQYACISRCASQDDLNKKDGFHGLTKIYNATNVFSIHIYNATLIN